MILSTQPQRAARATSWLPLIAIVLVGLALRLYDIGAKSLWLDEAFSVWMGWQPLGDLWRYVVWLDQHPPLYYTLLHLWMALGDGEAIVRGFSALWSVLTLPVMYLLGARIGGRAMGLLAALILSLAPLHVGFAQDARMYAMLTWNASLALLCMLHLLDGDQNQEPRAENRPSQLGSWFLVLGSLRWWLGMIAFTKVGRKAQQAPRGYPALGYKPFIRHPEGTRPL
jgi:uncharacterized membrane protein